jgi:hypothetical protein
LTIIEFFSDVKVLSLAINASPSHFVQLIPPYKRSTKMNQFCTAGSFLVLVAFSNIASGAGICGKAPYTVEMKDVGIEVRANLWNGALKSIQKKTDGGLTAVAGASLIRTAYAGTMNQSMLHLMKFYSCRLRAQVEADVKDPAAKKTALEQITKSQAVMTDRLGEMLDPDVLISLPEKQKQRELLRKVTRLPSDPVIDLALFDKALSDITDDMFIRGEMVDIWVGADLGSGITVGACGGALRDVVAATTGPIQISLSDFRANYRLLVDGSEYGQRMAFQNILNHAVTTGPTSIPARDYTSVFKNCSTVESGIKQVLGAATPVPTGLPAPVVPVVGTAPGTVAPIPAGAEPVTPPPPTVPPTSNT